MMNGENVKSNVEKAGWIIIRIFCFCFSAFLISLNLSMCYGDLFYLGWDFFIEHFVLYFFLGYMALKLLEWAGTHAFTYVYNKIISYLWKIYAVLAVFYVFFGFYMHHFESDVYKIKWRVMFSIMFAVFFVVISIYSYRLKKADSNGISGKPPSPSSPDDKVK